MPVPEAESMVLDFDGWLGQQPAPDRAGIEEHLRTVDVGNRDAEKKRLASMFAVADATHLDLPTVNDQWETVRGGFAEQKGKDWLAVKDDEGAFYERLKTSLTQQRDERHLLAGLDDQRAPNAQQAWDASLVHQAAEAGYAGKSYADALSAWQEVAKGKPGYDPERASVYEEAAQKAHADMAATVEKVRPIAQQVYSSLAQERDVQGGAPVAAPAVLLRGLTPDEKDVAFRMVGDMSNAPGGKGRAEAFGEALGRSFENLGVGGGSAALRDQLLQHEFHAGETVTEPNALAQVRALYGVETSEKATGGGPGAGAASLGAAFSSRNGRQLTADEAAQWNKDLGAAVEDLDTAERARKFGQEKVDPTTAGGWFFRKAVMPVAESAALMAAMEIPGAWAPSIELTARGFQDDEYARLRALGMTAAQANQRAALVGAAQAASFKLTATLLGKTALPATSAVLRRFGGEVTADALEGFAFNGSRAARYAANTAEGVISGTVLMTLQNHVIPAMVQDLTTNDPRFDVNWSDVWSEAGKALPDTMLGMVLLAGTGALLKTSQQTQDAKALRDYTGSKAAMRLNGYSLEQIDQIQAAPIQERADMLRSMAPETAPTGDAKAAVVADAVRLAKEEQAAFEAKRQNETAGATEAADYAVRVTRDAGGWKVVQANGKTVDASSADAARVIRDHLRQVNSQAEGDALVSIVDNWHAKAPEGTQRETTITGETARGDAQGITYSRDGKVTRENTDSKTLDALHEEAQMDAKLSGNEGIDVIVNGSNSVEFREKVGEGAAQVVQRLELNQSESTALTALHEQAEAAWRTGIARGAITLEETARAIAAVAGALDPAQARTAEEKAFRERVQRVAAGKGSDIEVRETVSELAVADAIGRRRDGSAMPAGAVTTSLDAAIRNAVDASEAKTLGKFRAFLRAAKQYFRGVLGTVAALKKARKGGGAEEFDKLISKITGLDEQAGHDAKLAGDLTDITGPLPKYIPPTPEEEAAGIAFSLRPVTEAYKKLADETGFPAVSIGHLAEKGKVPLEELKANVLKEWRAGNVVLSQGDWSHADEATRAGAVTTPTGDRYLQVRWLDPAFRISPGKRLELIQNRIDAALAKDPERRRELARRASDKLQALQFAMETERFTPRGDVIRPIEEQKSKAELNKEQGVRQALRAQELVDEGMSKLSSSTLQAYGNGLQRLEESNLIGTMLSDHGKLISASRAAKEGKYGEYDGTPWIPRQWYARKGGLMPDEMAAALHKDGLLREGTPEALWSALAAEIQTIRNNNEAWKVASEKVKEIEQKAGEQSRAEANAWRDNQDAMQAKDHSPRARLVRDLRTLDAILSVLPPEVRGKVGGFVKLAQLGSNDARVKEIERRIDKISGLVETHLQKESVSALNTLLERAKPNGGAGERAGGKIGVEGHRFFVAIESVKDLPEGAVRDRQDLIEAKMGQPIDDAERARLLEEWGMLHAYGAFEKKTAAEMDSAVTQAEQVYRTGRNQWNEILAQRAQERADLRQIAVSEIGNAGGGRARQDAFAGEAQGGQRRKLTEFLGNAHLSFAQRISRIFGKGVITDRYERAVTDAYHRKAGAINEHRKALQQALLTAFGAKSWGNVQDKLLRLQQPKEKSGVFRREGFRSETRDFPVDVAQRIVDGDMSPDVHGLGMEDIQALEEAIAANEAAGSPRSVLQLDVTSNEGTPTEQRISELQAVHLTMLARTEQYRRAMEKHGWDEQAQKQLEAMLSPEAKAIRAFLSQRYEAGYAGMNEVFKPMFGIDLPKVKNYAPGYFEHAGTQTEMDPFGTGVEAGGLAAGFLKSRKNHLAEPTVIDALQAFWQHTMQTEHWKAFAPTISEMRSVLGSVDVRHSVEADGGRQAAADLSSWISHIEQNGVREAQSNAWLARVTTGLTRARLAFNIGTWMKHLPNAFASLADVPAMDFMRGLGNVLSGNADKTLAELWKSDLIRNRIELSFTPELRQIIQGDKARGGLPTKVGNFLDWGTARIPWIASAFTTFSAAIAHDYHLRSALESGMSEAHAKEHAMKQTELTVARTAQPESLDRKSLAEIERKGVGKIAMMFVTPERQQLGLALAAIMNAREGSITKAEAARVLFSTWVLAPVLMQTMVGLSRYMFTDEDAEEAWNWKRYATAVALGPISGVFGLGQLAEVAASHFKGEITRAGGSPFVTAAQGIFSGGKKVDAWMHDEKNAELHISDLTRLAAGVSELMAGFTDVPVEALSIVDRLFRQADHVLPDSQADKDRKEKKAIAKERRDARAN